MKYYIYLLLVSCFFVSCTKMDRNNQDSFEIINQNYEKEDHFFKTREIDKIPLSENNCNIIFDNINIENDISHFSLNKRFNNPVLNRIYSFFSKKNKRKEYILEFQESQLTRKNVYMHFFLEKNKKSGKGFYIKWKNSPCDKLANYPSLESWYYNWDIDNMTDTIYTNLPKYLIHYYCLGFEGVIINDTNKKVVFSKSINLENADSLLDIVGFK
jgi:hypothetical protein